VFQSRHVDVRSATPSVMRLVRAPPLTPPPTQLPTVGCSSRHAADATNAAPAGFHARPPLPPLVSGPNFGCSARHAVRRVRTATANEHHTGRPDAHVVLIDGTSRCRVWVPSPSRPPLTTDPLPLPPHTNQQVHGAEQRHAWRCSRWAYAHRDAHRHYTSQRGEARARGCEGSCGMKRPRRASQATTGRRLSSGC